MGSLQLQIANSPFIVQPKKGEDGLIDGSETKNKFYA